MTLRLLTKARSWLFSTNVPIHFILGLVAGFLLFLALDVMKAYSIVSRHSSDPMIHLNDGCK